MTDETNETEWTDEERKALEALPREVDPGRLLEERTVAALKERELLGDRAGNAPGGTGGGTGGGRRRGPGGDRGGFHPAWWAAGMAAALALFFAGLSVGPAGSGLTTDDLATALRQAEAAERPSLVQQTGSLYVNALATLAVGGADRETVGTGVEVGLAALYAAAYELARLHPEDPRLRTVIRALEQPPQDDGDPETDVHWF